MCKYLPLGIRTTHCKSYWPKSDWSHQLEEPFLADDLKDTGKIVVYNLFDTKWLIPKSSGWGQDIRCEEIRNLYDIFSGNSLYMMVTATVTNGFDNHCSVFIPHPSVSNNTWYKKIFCSEELLHWRSRFPV